jgi:hypothetical protein
MSLRLRLEGTALFTHARTAVIISDREVYCAGNLLQTYMQRVIGFFQAPAWIHTRASLVIFDGFKTLPSDSSFERA